MRLAYEAYDKSGRQLCSVMDAQNVAEAADKLRQQNLMVATITPVDEPANGSLRRFRLPRGRIGQLRDLSMFTRQLHSLVRSGTQLTQGLSALERQARHAEWRGVVADIRARVEQGGSLADAVGSHPEHFDAVYKNVVAAGEASGQLTELLDRLATLTRRRAHVLSMIRGAMVYPILLACVGAVVMTVLMLFVVPRFATLFAALGAARPPTTAFLIACSDFLRQYWYAVLAGLIVAAAGVRHGLLSPSGRRRTDSLLLRLPVLGTIVKSFSTAHIARLLGQLLHSHLPIQDSLRLVRNTTSNAQYAALLSQAELLVSHGEPMSSAFRDSNLITPAIYEAIHSGEQSGQVGGLLLELAEFLDDENEVTLKSLTSIVEPVMLVLMAVMVGFVAMSIFLPLFDVTSLMSGGG